MTAIKPIFIAGPCVIESAEVLDVVAEELVRLQAPRVYAVDPEWLGLEGESGYDIAWPQYIGLKIILR